MKKTLGMFIASFALSTIETANAAEAYTEYCAGIVFRETPYADIRCTRPLVQEEIKHTKHFELEHDSIGRLTEVRHMQSGELRAFSDRFVRAPRIVIHYEGNQEIRRFFNEWGDRTLVSGNVYETRFTLDAEGRRTELKFYDLNGKPIDNDFSISRYTWKTLENGQVIEHRYNVTGAPVRNRPGFGYMVTRFAYDTNGLLTRMYNLGVDGKELTPDDAGIAMTKISYDNNRQFIQWLNLDMQGNPKRGMSGIAEIKYVPSRYSSEQIATFNDADGSPQLTRWGAHKVAYDFDQFGNPVNRLHYGKNGELVQSSSGIAQIRSIWTEDGAYLLSEKYFDKEGKPTASSYSGVHAVVTTLGKGGKPATITFQDLNSQDITHKGQGYATEVFEYDSSGRLILRKFMTPSGAAANHSTWGVSRFEYKYHSDGRLKSAHSFDANGTKAKAMWNPAH